MDKRKPIRKHTKYFFNLVTIKVFNLFNIAHTEYKSSVTKNVNLQQTITIYNNFISIVSSIIISFAAFLPLFLRITFVRSGNITVGELIAFNSYSGMLFSPLTTLVGLLTTIKTIEIYEKRISILLNFERPQDKVKKTIVSFLMKIALSKLIHWILSFKKNLTSQCEVNGLSRRSNSIG